MYAIIRAGGKQYKVQAGDTLRVEKLTGELGSEFDISEVLVVGGDKVFVGEPLVKGAFVTVVVTQQSKSPKIIVFKKKRRQGYRRMRGHRQLFTELFIKSITDPEGQVTETEKTAQVFDPVKKAARLKKSEELRQKRKQAGATSKVKTKSLRKNTKEADATGSAPLLSGTKKKATKKVSKAKKKAAKKSKKSGAKKKTTAHKKTGTKKKAAKKS